MILKGFPASIGLFEGKVKIYSEGKKFDRNDILIASSTSPEMSIEIFEAGAVLTECGGMLSHASIFCREMGKPCVVGIDGLLDNVSEGMTIRIDGGNGTAEIISNE